MLNQKERAEKFFDAISRDAHDRNEELKRQNKDMLDLGLKKAEEEARAGAQAMIDRERRLGEQKLNREISVSSAQKRAELTQRREEITEKIFAAARDKLVSFTQSSGYEEFLKKSAKEFSHIFESGEVVIYLREEDMRFKDAVAEAFGRACRVEPDASVSIGGCRCVSEDGALAADDTLATRLESQREWFLANSGMSVLL